MAATYTADVDDPTLSTIAEMVPSRNVVEDSGVVSIVVRFTPSLASAFLDRNTKNRGMSKQNRSKIGIAMQGGYFDLNGETIKIGKSGRLLDGQHRLEECVRTGCDFESVVVFGLDDSVFDTVDQGKARAISDVLSINGEVNTRTLAATANSLYQFACFDGANVVGKSNKSFNSRVCQRVIDSHSELRRSVMAVGGCRLLGNAVGAFLHYVFSLSDPRLADEFVDVMKNGTMSVGRPFNVFREWVINSNIPVSSMVSGYTARAVKAFNAEKTGGTPKLLKFIEGETFPRVVGLDYDKLARSVK
jgi:hypothetical protein